MKTVPKIKLGKIHTPFTCLYIHISMLIGFSICKVIMTPNPIRVMLCLTSETTGSTLSKKFSTLLFKFYLKASNIEKLLVKEAKNLTDLSWTVKWDSLKSGIISNLHKINNQSKIFWKLSIGKLLVVDLSNMMKDVLIMTILLKTSKLDCHFWKINLITLQKQPYQQILLDILKVHWLFWHI